MLIHFVSLYQSEPRNELSTCFSYTVILVYRYERQGEGILNLPVYSIVSFNLCSGLFKHYETNNYHPGRIFSRRFPRPSFNLTRPAATSRRFWEHWEDEARFAQSNVYRRFIRKMLYIGRMSDQITLSHASLLTSKLAFLRCHHLRSISADINLVHTPDVELHFL